MWWRKKRRPVVERPIAEPLEPRILYAADLSAGLVALGVDAATQTGPGVEHRVLDSDGDYVTPASVQVQPHELAFVDRTVPDRDAILADLRRQQAAGRPIEIVEIGGDEDGVARIGAVLATRSDITAVHLISHGTDGAVQLGNVRLDAGTLAVRGGEIALWRNALTQDADFLLYGCDVAGSVDGQRLVTDLATFTGADVAASEDPTGHTSRGGDWQLEFSSGTIQAGSAVTTSFQQTWGGLLLASTSEIQVNQTIANDQAIDAENRSSQQAVALDAAGNYVVVWTSAIQDGNRNGVYARRFDASGTPITGEVLVNATTHDNQQSARVVSDSAGNFVVTWTSQNQDGTVDSVYARRFDANGVALTAEARVNTTATGSQSDSVIAMNASNGDYVIAWQGEGPGDGSGIFFRRYFANGVAKDATDQLANLTDGGSESDPAVTMDASGNFVVFWEQGKHIYFQRFDADGGALGARGQVDDILSTSSGLAAASDSAGNFTVAYREEVLLPGIWGKGFNADGTEKYSWFQAASGGAASVSIDMADDGSFVLAYESTDDGVGLGVFARKYNADGSANGNAFQVNQTIAYDQSNAAVAVVNSNNFIVAWSGKSSLDPNGVVVRQYGANLAPAITSDGAGSTASLSVAENSTLVTTVTSTDADLPAQPLTFSISGGADAAKFSINPNTGALGFTAAPNFEAPTDAGFDNVYNLTVQVSDGTLTDTQAISVTVTNINDAPMGTDTTVTTSEDSPYTFSAANFGFSDAGDSPANAFLAVKIATLPGAGTLTINGAAVSAGQTITVADINLGRLVFTPVANANGAAYASFTFQTQDDGGTANGGVDLDASPNILIVNVSAVNDAPVLAGANNLNAINEDVSSGTNHGTLVSALIAGMVTETDGAAASGIAVTAVDNTNGAWQYTTDGGDDWTAFGAPTAAAARLLAADASTSVRFVPNANWNGTVTGGLSFRAWDQTAGTAGGTANTGTNGGTTAYSSTTASASITVNSVNDAPAGTNKTVTTNEDTAYTFAAADFGFTDPNDTPSNALGAVRISTLPGGGTLTNNGVAVTTNQVVTVADINLGRLVFTPAPDANGTGHASFTFRVRDDGGTANGGVNLDASPNTMSVNVTAINDAPLNTVPAAQATAYNVPLVLSSANGNRISVADVDAGAAGAQVTISATNGTLSLAGVAGLTFTAGANGAASMAFTGTLASINTALNGLTFTPTTNFSGAAAISIQSDDLGNSGAGGPQGDSDTVAVTVNASTPLIIVGDGFATAEDTILNANSVLGNDSDPLMGVMSVVAVNGNAAALGGAITLASGAQLSMHADGTFTYNPNGAFESLAHAGGMTDSFTYTVNSTSGGSGSGTAVITLSGVNDAPALAGTNDLNNIDEDQSGESGTLVSALIAGHVSDADSSAAAGIAVVAVDNTNGAWQYTINGGTNWSDFGVPTSSSARLLAADTSTSVRFVPNADWNGTVAGGIRFMAWDQTSGVAGGSADATTNGGSSAFSSSAFSASITVGAVNDAPSGTNGTVTINEDSGHTLTAGDFGLTDASDSPANILSAVRIATLPGAGTLTNNGAAVSAGQTITLADINLGRLVFTPGSNANGAAYASFTFQVQDDGGTTNGGIDLDASPNTLTVNVTALNDAPAGTSTTVTTSEDTVYTFSMSDFGFTDTGDAPANTLLAVKIATLPGAGTLTNNGVAVSAGQTITVADISLGRLVFTPVANANGTAYANFSFQVQDDGGTANGGVDLDGSPNTLTIDVTAVNDAPAGTDRGVTLIEDSTYTFGSTDFVFSDGADSPANVWRAVRITTLPGAGMLALNGSPVAVGQFLSAANIAAGLLVFTPAADGSGSGYAGFTFQMQDDGGSTAGGNDLDASPNRFTFDVVAINDAPTGANTGVNVLPGVSYVFIASDFPLADTRDTPADALAAVIIDSLPTAGTLSLGGTAVTAGQVVNVTDIALARLAFSPNGATASSFTYRVQDNGGTSNGGTDTATIARTMRLTVATPAVAATDAAADATSAATMAPPAPSIAPAATTTAATTPASTPPAPPAVQASSSAAADDGGAGLAGSADPADGLLGTPLQPLASHPMHGGDATGVLPADPRQEYALTGERKAFSFEAATLIDNMLAQAGRSETTRVSFDQFLTSLRSQGFIEELDRLRDDASHEFDLEKSFAVTATGVTFGLSVAYVLWLVRSGVLMGSLLSSLPAWRVLDPLPVLAREGEADEDDDDLGEAPPDDADHPLQPLRGY